MSRNCLRVGAIVWKWAKMLSRYPCPHCSSYMARIEWSEERNGKFGGFTNTGRLICLNCGLPYIIPFLNVVESFAYEVEDGANKTTPSIVENVVTGGGARKADLGGCPSLLSAEMMEGVSRERSPHVKAKLLPAGAVLNG